MLMSWCTGRDILPAAREGGGAWRPGVRLDGATRASVVDALAGHWAEPSPSSRVVSLHVLGPPAGV